jgi:hypothetical protein
MGGALLFWGWETGLFFIGLTMAIVVEGSRIIPLRWEFTDTDLNRISDLCWVLSLGAGLVLYSTEDRLIFIFKFAQWLPMTFFPLVVSQAYGNRETMPLSVFSWLLRRTPDTPLARKSFNISFAYFAICLTGISASTKHDVAFYWGMAALVLLALTSVRPLRVSRPAWIVLIVATALAGEMSQQELRRFQNYMEGALGGWLGDIFRQPQDSRELKTSMGQPGQIKQSGKIVLRVHSLPGEIPPGLLREACYDAYKDEIWLATSNEFTPLTMGSSTNDSIRLMPPKGIGSAVEIASYLQDGQGTLVLPHGAYELDNFPAVVKTNRLGVAGVDSGPGLINYRVRYGGGISIDGPPVPMDRTIPSNETDALEEVAQKLGLAEMTERQRIRAVSRYFKDSFRYSLTVPGKPREGTPLSQFLLKTHAGHCEFFATATVLLLREAGVSARYVTGYAVPESALHGDTYLIRESHAHAWALVFHSDTGTWEQVDNTPSGWAEAQTASWWQPISDFFSDIYFQFSKWRWGKTSFAQYAERLLIPLILYLVARIVTSQHRKGKAVAGANGNNIAWPGLDSELFVINRRLSEVHLSRQPQEPLANWQRRLEEAFPTSAALRHIFQLHRRLRFDPIGLENHDRERLKREAEAWLAEHAPPSLQRK